MKTLRDALLQRHQAATPKLDAIRKRVLAAELAPRQCSPARAASLEILPQVWRELFWSSRRLWAGLACAWCVIVVLNLAVALDESAPPLRAGQTAPTAAQLRLVLAAQEHLRTELLATPSDSAPPLEPRPRSEYRRQEAAG